MAKQTLILLGTKKGAFIVSSDTGRRSWELRGPFCETWPMNQVVADPGIRHDLRRGRQRMVRSGDLEVHRPRRHLDPFERGFGVSGRGRADQIGVERRARASTGFTPGVQPAGLFRSDEQGQSWQHVAGLQNHPSRPHWNPGGAGLILHSLVPHPTDARQIWIGISAAGVFYTADGGETWEPRNRGTRADYMPEDQRYPEFGQCVHCVVMAPGMPDRLYQQNHCGMYRSDNGGRHWESIEAGLPSTFGFPAVVHPRDPATLFLLPLNGDTAGRYVPDGRTAVWRTRNAGESWEALRDGLPQGNTFFGVLRQAMAVDRLSPAGVYFGTSTGSLFASADEGDSWTCIAQHLPTILSVETLVVDR